MLANPEVPNRTCCKSRRTTVSIEKRLGHTTFPMATSGAKAENDRVTSCRKTCFHSRCGCDEIFEEARSGLEVEINDVGYMGMDGRHGTNMAVR
jgi:hypothetical protein